MNQSVLGKGLGSLIPNAGSRSINSWGPTIKTVSDSEQIVQLSVEDIEANPFQPRSQFDNEKLKELADSIKEYGVIQPLIVTRKDDGTYQLIAGERRLKASKLVGLETVPAVVRKAEDQKKLEVSLVENVQRQNLNPLEEAISYQRLVDEFGMTQEEVGNRVGKSRSTIANVIRLLTLPQEALQAIRDEKITFSHAKVILSYDTEREQVAALHAILEGKLTVQEATKAAGPKKPNIAAAADPVLESWASKVSARLGFTAKILKRRRGGTLEVQYGSEEELKTLLDRILGG